MSNTLIIRRRIRSVGNVKQITKAMELTAAAKMHRAQESVLGARPYATRALQLVRSLEERGNTASHPLLRVSPIKKELLIVVTTNRGLAGGINTTLIRTVVSYVKKSTHPIELIIIGKKGAVLLEKLGLPIIATFTELPPDPTVQFSRPISLLARDQFLHTTYDIVNVAYNHYQSTLTQIPTITQLLPFLSHPATSSSTENISQDKLNESLFEPNPARVLEVILPRLIDQLLFEILLESAASEHAARMVAMHSATDNATDLLDDLQLTFNSIRQSSITAEMAEISASMTALT